MKLKIQVKNHIKKHFGEQCKSFDFGCPSCQAWLSYYYLFEMGYDKLKFDNKTARWYLESVEEGEVNG